MVGTLLVWLPLVSLACSGRTPDASGTRPAQLTQAEHVGPQLGVAETSYDHGEVDYARPYNHAFAIRNTGDEPLRLTLTRKSCKCAEVQFPADGIGPGQSGQVLLGWVPIPGQYGAYALAADFDTNDPKQPHLRLEVRGQFNPVVRLWPENWSEVDFQHIQPGQVAEREIKVFSTKLASFGLVAAASHPGLKVSTRPLAEGSRAGDHTVRSGYAVKLQTAPELPKGYLRETLLLTIRGEDSRQIAMPVYGDVASGALRVVPGEVEFKKPKITDADSQKVQVQFLVPSDQEKVEIDRFEPAFLVIEKPRQLKRGLWQFTVQIPPNHPEAAGQQAGGFVEGKIVLKTTAASAPEFPIRVKWVRPER
jgi:hypothetical protein